VTILELAPQLDDREAADLLLFLSEQVYEARLRDGGRLRDATDFKQWLLELAEQCGREGWVRNQQWREIS
jgi:hypothetical protein